MKTTKQIFGLFAAVVLLNGSSSTRAADATGGISDAQIREVVTRAVNRGWIDASNMEVARKAFAGIAKKVTADGGVNGTCIGTNIGQDLDYYIKRQQPDDDLHGRGVVLLAGTELLLAGKNNFSGAWLCEPQHVALQIKLLRVTDPRSGNCAAGFLAALDLANTKVIIELCPRFFPAALRCWRGFLFFARWRRSRRARMTGGCCVRDRRRTGCR